MVCGLTSVSWSKTLCCWVFWMYFSLNTKTQQSTLWPISQKLSDSHWNYLDGQIALQVGVKYVFILGWTAPVTTHFRFCLNNHLSSLLPLPVFLPVWTGWSHGSSQTRARSSGTNFFKLSHPRKALQRLQCWDPYQCFGQSPVNMAPVSPHLQYVWPSCFTSLHGAAALPCDWASGWMSNGNAWIEIVSAYRCWSRTAWWFDYCPIISHMAQIGSAPCDTANI